MPAPIDPQMLQMILAAAKQKQAQLAPQIALTPKDMSASDMEQKALGLGLVDPTMPVQGGVPSAAPAQANPTTPDEAAAAAAEAARAKGQMPAPAPAPVAPGGQLGPGVTMDPQVTIKPTPPQAVLAPPQPTRSDMPDPHAPDPADEDPDGGADDDGDEDDLGYAFG